MYVKIAYVHLKSVLNLENLSVFSSPAIPYLSACYKELRIN